MAAGQPLPGGAWGIRRSGPGGGGGEQVDEQAEPGLLTAGGQPVAAAERGKAVQGAPRDFGVGTGVAVGGQGLQRGGELAEAGPQRGGVCWVANGTSIGMVNMAWYSAGRESAKCR
jgi:hypothetical protein